jgi:hypothetical protein
MTTINNWCYSFDDDRPAPPKRPPVRCLEDEIVGVVTVKQETHNTCPMCSSKVRSDDVCRRPGCRKQRALAKMKEATVDAG